MSDGQATPPIVRFADFRLDLQSGELWKNGGERVLLPDQPLKVLRALVLRHGALVTRDELRQELWPADTFVDFEHGLNAVVKRLREVLGDSASDPQLIETIPRRGYRLRVAVEIEALPVITAPPAPPPELVPPMEAPLGPAGRWRGRRLAGVIASAIVIAMGLLAWSVWASRPVDPITARTIPIRVTSTSGLNVEPALSRDGTLVAFASDRTDGGNLDIWIQPVAGGKAMPLTKTPADESEPAFSADGSWVVYTQRGTGIHIVGTMGGLSRLVVPTPWGRTPRFSPTASRSSTGRDSPRR
jgi:DNA-binding winged helix-turn-helix (wHTH) protein